MITTYQRDIWRRQQADLLRCGLRQVGDVDVEPITLEEARAHLRVDTYEEGSPPETVSDDDAWIEAQIPAAREYCEQYLGRALAPRVMELAANAFPTVTVSSPPGPSFALPFGPVQSIDSIIFQDQAAADAAYTAAYDTEFAGSADVAAATAAGVTAAAAALYVTVTPTVYELDSFGVPSRGVLAYQSSWPTARAWTGSVRIRYTTGYSIPGESPQVFTLPKMARSAILLMLGHLYENREAVTTGTLIEVPLGVQALLDLLPRERLGLA